MEKTISHRKPIKSPFDILHSQLEKEDSHKDEFKIPVRKIFDSVPKPTELKPLVMDKEFNTQSSESEIIFKAPHTVLSYVDKLIHDKRPLKTLRFDIEESSSIEEATKFINDSKHLEQSEKKKLLDLLGQEESKEVSPKSQNKVSGEINMEKIDNDLKIAREDYIEKLVPHLKKIDADKQAYEKLMMDLGVNKAMPKKSEPKDLTLAREEYINVLNSKKQFFPEQEMSIMVEETALFRENLAKSYKSNADKFISKTNKIWEKTKSDGNDLVYSFLLEDIDFPIRSSGTTNIKYDGLRARLLEVPVENESVQNETIVAESVNPKETVYPSDFEGKNVLVVRGEEGKPNMIKVLFDGKEIAKGELTEKGPNIKINPEFKAGWLFTKNIEQRAFDELILPFLKTLKI